MKELKYKEDSFDSSSSELEEEKKTISRENLNKSEERSKSLEKLEKLEKHEKQLDYTNKNKSTNLIKKTGQKYDFLDMEEINSNSLNECNFKKYEHDNPEDISIINGLSEIEISKENKQRKEEFALLERTCGELRENLKELEQKNKNVRFLLDFINKNE